MNKIIYIIAGLIIVFAGLCYYDHYSNPLVRQYYVENDNCRDGDPEFASTWASCLQRDFIVIELTNQNYCYGREDQAEYEKTWRKCPSK